jgi:RNA polymerase sigma factor (sigma-70 family)
LPNLDRELEALFEREYAGLCRYAYRIVNHPEDAADIVQETFLRFCKVWREEGVRVADRALLYSLARNLAIDCARRTQTRQRLAPAAGNLLVMPAARSPEQACLDRERRDQLKEVLGTLNPRELGCLTLRHNGLSYQEIAKALTVNPGSVGPTIARALRKLRDTYAALSKNEVESREARHARPGGSDRLRGRPASSGSPG